jgi:hypothetical protein
VGALGRHGDEPGRGIRSGHGGTLVLHQAIPVRLAVRPSGAGLQARLDAVTAGPDGVRDGRGHARQVGAALETAVDLIPGV